MKKQRDYTGKIVNSVKTLVLVIKVRSKLNVNVCHPTWNPGSLANLGTASLFLVLRLLEGSSFLVISERQW